MAVAHNDDGWDYQCPTCEFISRHWPTRALATARGGQHEAEHETGELMQDKREFLTERSAH